jgi:hypothetical protein
MPSIRASSLDITQSPERGNLVEAKEAFENFVDDLEVQYPGSQMLQGLLKVYGHLNAELDQFIQADPDIYRIHAILSGWYTAQRSVMICACENHVPDSLSGPDALRPQFAKEMGTNAASRLKDLLNELMVASNAARKKTIADMTLAAFDNAPTESALHFHRIRATAFDDGQIIGIRYRLYGTSCVSREDSCYTSCAVWEPSFNFVTHKDIDVTWLMPSQNIIEASASNEVQELDNGQLHATTLDIGAAPYILATCKAAWTFKVSNRRTLPFSNRAFRTP